MTSTSAKHVLTTIAVLAVAAATAFALFVGAGAYNFAADDPHTAAVHSLLETMRERSIQTRAKDVPPSDLSNPMRISRGAGNYNAMCVGCHLAPGMGESELSKGLYPAPPNLSKEKVKPAQAFWVIKHGIKASGMPAWGKSMSDEDVWNMAAFLQELPNLNADRYKEMVARSEGHQHNHGSAHDEEADHDHEHKESHGTVSAADTATSVPVLDGTHDTEAQKPVAAAHVHANGPQHHHNAKGAQP